MSEDELIHDSATASEIVRAAVSFWNQWFLRGGQGSSAVKSDPFAVAGISSSRDWRTAVTLSFPRVPPEVFFAWLGPRLVLWPAGVVHERRTSIVSSRIGKRRDLKRGWFDALRTAVIRQDPAECLCCVSGTAPEDAIIRSSELFGARRLRIDVAPGGNASEAELVEWLELKARVQQPSGLLLEDVAYVSPACQPDITDQSCDADRKCQSPVQDTALVLAAERIVGLSCRAEGHVESLLKRHLQDEQRNAPVLLATVAESESAAVSQSLVSLGAVPWLLGRADVDGEDRRTASSNTRSTRARSPESICFSVSDGPLQVSDEWLSHWTRPRQGPWAEQRDEEFLDELILGCQTADRSAFAALLRIVAQCQITASRSVRNADKTVSFTAVPLSDFRDRRVYRRHKQRFDFEPWGIAVRKAALETCGCCAVTYVDRDTYDNVAEGDRLFQQLNSDDGGRIDWSQEREWRYAGNLDLSGLDAEDICVFVDTHDEATALRAVAPWRVVQVPPKTKPA